jgi:hypothetical protein
MYHSIAFERDLLAEIDVPGEGRMPQILIEKGTRLRTEIHP